MSRADQVQTEDDPCGGASGVLASDSTQATASHDTDAGTEHPPRLVVPEGLLIDDIVRDRMERRLRRLPQEVDGIAALLNELPPGVSCRVHAEWKSLISATAPETLQPIAPPVRGAALLRPGVPFSVAGDTVDAPGASLLCDAGAVVHDPRQPFGVLMAASKRGRPPFPRRPVVVLLALDTDVRLAEWARRLSNGLARRDIESRLAVPAPPEGLYLSRPCLPCEESIRALAPDAIVALDAHAAERASPWCGRDRSTVVIELSEEIVGAVELVSWQINRAEGRLRARIGRTVDPVVLAALVLRLCAGPHPIAPDNGIDHAAKRATGAHGSATATARPDTLLLTGTLASDITVRVEGLVDHLAAEGIRVEVASPEEGIPRGARSVPLVLLSGIAGAPGIEELIAHRREAGRVTVLDVGPHDLVRSERGFISPPRLDPEVASLAAAGSMVSSPAGAVHRAAVELGVRTFVLPTLLSRGRAAKLLNARVHSTASDHLVVGWRFDIGNRLLPSYPDAVVEALLKLLDDHARVRLHVVAEPGRLPARLRRRDRVVVTRDAPAPDVLAGWAVYLLTPEIVAEQVADDLRDFLEASLAGVPSVLPLAARRAIDGHPSPQLVVRDVQDTQAWLAALWSMLGDGRRLQRRIEETLRYGAAISGSAASRGVVSRFIGWALYEGKR